MPGVYFGVIAGAASPARAEAPSDTSAAPKAPAKTQADASPPAPPPAGSRRADPALEQQVTPPRPLETPVVYPEGETRDAEVVLELTVSPEGGVTDAAVVAGMPPFDRAAMGAVTTWRFEPARRGARPIAARLRYTLRFDPPKAPEASSAGGAPPARSANGQSELPQRPTAPAARTPAEVVVRGEKLSPGSVRILRSEARNLPGAFGDPLRAIEAEPGIVPIVSGLPSFYIRGAPPANVGYFIDGVDVPLLYHAFFGPSVIHPAMIESVDFFRGSAPTVYGRFAGPIVSANLSPLESRLGGEANVRAIDVGAYVQVPFAPCEDHAPDCARGKARASGRYSYTGLVLSLLSTAELAYWDYQGQVTYDLGPSDTVGILGFGAYDFFDSGAENTDRSGGGKVQFHRLDLRYDHRWASGATARVAVTGGYDRTGGTHEQSSAVTSRSIRVRTDLSAPLGANATLRAGADAREDGFGLETSPALLSFADYTTLFPERSQTLFGAYVSLDWMPVPFVTVSPGLRADHYAVGGDSAKSVDPRLALKFDLGSGVTLDHSFGVGHQQPNFAAQVPAAQVADLTGGLQEAWMWSTGVRYRAPCDLTFTASVYQNTYFNALDPIGGGRDFSIDRTVLGRRATIHAQGFELGISRALTRKLGGFISYTLSHSRQTTGHQDQVSGFDRPHVLQFSLSYDLGRSWRIGGRAVYYSGVPELNLEGSPHFTADRRGDPYFRTDLRAEKRWQLGERGFVSAVAEILNATSTREAVRLDCGTQCRERFSGPVILPSVGVEAGF